MTIGLSLSLGILVLLFSPSKGGGREGASFAGEESSWWVGGKR